MISVQEALSHITSQARSFGTQTISIEQALGRIWVQHINPNLTFALNGHPAEYIHNTEFQLLTHSLTHSYANRKHGSNIFVSDGAVQIEEDLVRSSMLCKKNQVPFAKNKWINDSCQSILAINGHNYVQVEQLPEVAIVSTGNEIVAAGSVTLPHQIRDSNSYTISSSLRRFGIHSPAKALVPDDKEALRDTITSLLNKDILIISGGVSKGDADYVPKVLASLGVKELFHGVKLKPGAPFWFGRTPAGGVVFGLPGNPLALQVACRIFLEPYICACFNISPRSPILLPLATEQMKKSKYDEFFPCKIVNTDAYSRLLPIRYNGSGDIGAALQSNGIALQREMHSNLPEGTLLPFYAW
ncbi:molybdopterin molybdotransferase MoeA [Rhodocytophaga rosea]|uniref:Molybdopterin molybdenumtransferase n=1 Tax=Rhodocytophaga rosea TaxID=2704465 RepID=A0A6C0GII5_9BACT|nr:molybdopterin molybdotransferase MoeA [Rhodocytophaga rosea]QHT67493.1 molybdopterin molybdotransferase MoeA [Rhodocytophaga rosea]